MSLDIDLTEVRTTTVHSQNVTHNLSRMAEAAGLYKCLWRPEEHGFAKAADLVEPLTIGIAAMVAEPEKFRALDAANGWGTYDGFLPWLRELLEACKAHPNAAVSVSR